MRVEALRLGILPLRRCAGDSPSVSLTSSLCSPRFFFSAAPIWYYRCRSPTSPSLPLCLAATAPSVPSVRACVSAGVLDCEYFNRCSQSRALSNGKARMRITTQWPDIHRTFLHASPFMRVCPSVLAFIQILFFFFPFLEPPVSFDASFHHVLRFRLRR